MSALNDIQEALYSTLTNDYAVMALVTGVFDKVPQSQSAPYVSFGTRTEARLDTMGTWGKDATFELNVWSEYAGFKQAENILDAINAALDYQTLTVANWTTTVFCRFEDAVTIEDPDGVTKRIAARYRITVVP